MHFLGVDFESPLGCALCKLVDCHLYAVLRLLQCVPFVQQGDVVCIHKEGRSGSGGDVAHQYIEQYGA